MKLEIVRTLDRGVANKERLWLKALVPADLQYFIVFDTTYTAANTISNLQRHAYWFKETQVNPGDSIVLYTKKGTQSSTKNQDGTTTHFFFWGLDKTIWNRAEDCAVLFEVSSWATSQFGA